MKSAERTAECPVHKQAKYWLGRQDSQPILKPAKCLISLACSTVPHS